MLPVKLPDVHKLQVNFLNKVRSLQRGAGLLVPQKMAGKTPQLELNSRYELRERFIISLGPSAKELRSLGRGWLSHAFTEIIRLGRARLQKRDFRNVFFVPVAVSSP